MLHAVLLGACTGSSYHVLYAVLTLLIGWVLNYYHAMPWCLLQGELSLFEGWLASVHALIEHVTLEDSLLPASSNQFNIAA